MIRPEDLNEISKLAVVAAAILTDDDFFKATKAYAEKFKSQEATHLAVLARNTEQHKIKLATMSLALEDQEARVAAQAKAGEEAQAQLSKEQVAFKETVATKERALLVAKNLLQADRDSFTAQSVALGKQQAESLKHQQYLNNLEVTLNTERTSLQERLNKLKAIAA